MGSRDLFIVDDSHIKRVENDLIICHLCDKNISLKCKNFKCLNFSSLTWRPTHGQLIHNGTNDISRKKLHTIWHSDLAMKIIYIVNACKSFGIAGIAISSILP